MDPGKAKKRSQPKKSPSVVYFSVVDWAFMNECLAHYYNSVQGGFMPNGGSSGPRLPLRPAKRLTPELRLSLQRLRGASWSSFDRVSVKGSLSIILSSEIRG